VGFLSLARFGPAHAAWAQAATYLLLAAVTIRVGLKRTHARFGALLVTLLPGLATTALTMIAAAAAETVTSRTGLPSIGKFACDVGAGGVVWAFMAGIVFRRRALSAILKLKEQSSVPAMT